jgi:hypothetical protein
MGKINTNVDNTKKVEGLAKRLTTEGIRTEAQKAVSAGIKAGEISEEGIMIQFVGVEKSTGKFGDFWFIRGINMDETPIEILTSSKTLITLINENYQDLVNKIIVVSGTGQGFERLYNIDIVGPGNMKLKTE